MTIDLDMIQSMWETDSKIDIDNLHTESLNIPALHAKYFDIYNNISLLRKKAEQQKRNIRHDRFEYYTGKADPEVYVENPFPKKIGLEYLALLHVYPQSKKLSCHYPVSANHQQKPKTSTETKT